MFAKHFRSVSAALTILALGVLGAEARVAPPDAQAARDDKPIIQVALLLDTSGSMSGLIDQAKTQLWKVVNEFALAKHNGRAPALEVALYQYGNDGLSSESSWVQQICPLTYDLDKISEELFKLRTNGGEEYCGTVIKHAVENLKWSESKNALKVVFIAGNEPFTQGQVDFRQSCSAAIGKGILVNTIYCGPREEGISTNWQDGALMSDGRYMSIDQNQQVVDIAAPQDAEITRVNEAINKTYIPYGRQGAEGQARQTVQDSNALGASNTANASRAMAKISTFYCNDMWDLVDACSTKKIDLNTIKTEDLPEVMRKMSAEERKSYVDARCKERQDLQKKTAELVKARTEWVDAELKRRAVAEGKAETLDSAIVKIVRDQGSARGLNFATPRKP